MTPAATMIQDSHRVRRSISHVLEMGSRYETRQLLWRWFRIAFVSRLALMLVIHFTGADARLRLTKDAFLYDRTASAMAEHWRSRGATPWPARVDTFYWDCSYEWAMAGMYYLFGDSLLLGKFLSVVSGALTPLLFWRIAGMMYGDHRVARRVLIWTALFPSHVYYSCHMVRDSHATLAMGLVFLGLLSLSRPSTTAVKLALPAGLLLTAGFRFYMFFVLLLLIPGAVAISWLVSPGRRLRYATRIVLACGVVLAILGVLNVGKLLETSGTSRYMDLDFINHVRVKMNRGSGAMFDGSNTPELGTSPVETARGLVVGLYYFFVSVNPAHMGSIRQWMALPEILAVLYMGPSLIRGLRLSLRDHLGSTIHVLIVTAGISLVYSGFATNAGPLMRWRLQVVGIYIAVAAAGWQVRKKKLRSHRPVAMRRRRQHVPNSYFQ